MKRKASWAEVQQDKKRKIERLWFASMQLDSGFTPAERKAITSADHAIRSIKGGWLTRRIA